MLSNNLINCIYSGLSLERGLWLDIQEYMRKGWNKYFAPTGKMLNREGLGWINLKEGTIKTEGDVCWERYGNSRTITVLKVTKYFLLYRTVHKWVYLGNWWKDLTSQWPFCWKLKSMHLTEQCWGLSSPLLAEEATQNTEKTKLRKLWRCNSVWKKPKPPCLLHAPNRNQKGPSQ